MTQNIQIDSLIEAGKFIGAGSATIGVAGAGVGIVLFLEIFY